jgi:hypothetical protein
VILFSIYYHQIKVTRRRTICNTLGPGLPPEWLQGLDAYETFLLDNARRKRYDRLRDGDLLGMRRSTHALKPWCKI